MNLLQIVNNNFLDLKWLVFSVILNEFFWRFLIDFLTIIILVKFIYTPNYKNKEFVFTFYVFNIIIFLVSFLLNKVDLSMGTAFGLFAVFSMIRYRTEDVSIVDMTYLFLSIAIGLVSAVIKINDSNFFYENLFLSIICATIILLTFLLESKIVKKKERYKVVIYDNLEFIKVDKEKELIADIHSRTGILASRLFIQKIDFQKNSAQIKIYYNE